MSQIDYDKEAPASSFVGISVVVTSLLIVVIIIASYFLFASFLSTDQNQKYELSKTNRLDVLNKEYEKELSRLDWKDKRLGVVKVPIQTAVEHVIKTYNP